MRQSHDSGGFTIIEVLVVITVIIAVIAIGSSYLSGTFALRRSVDDVTNQIASMLQLGKLRSVRDGVEYRLVFADCTNINESDPDCNKCNSDASYEQYQEGDDEMTLILERGDSNVGSTTWCIESVHTKRFQSDLDLVASANLPEAGEPLNFTFTPKGMRRDFLTDLNDETLTITPGSDSNIDKCGRIGVSPAGSVTSVEGRWDGTQCNAILDNAPSPTPGPS